MAILRQGFSLDTKVGDNVFPIEGFFAEPWLGFHLEEGVLLFCLRFRKLAGRAILTASIKIFSNWARLRPKVEIF